MGFIEHDRLLFLGRGTSPRADIHVADYARGRLPRRSLQPALRCATFCGMNQTSALFGDLLRDWRQRRRLSQLDLALAAEVSQRHLSFIECGRAQPSRDMVVRLVEHLNVPVRERNALLVAAGYAPLHRERPLTDPALTAARDAVALVLAAYEPFPALAVDRHWTIVAANSAVQRLIDGLGRELLQPPQNALRISLHPKGLAPLIVNYGEWREHVLLRLARQIDQSADPQLRALRDELRSYPAPSAPARHKRSSEKPTADVAVPFQLQSGAGVLSFLCTTTVFGTPIDITLTELAIEAFLPADPVTAEALRGLAGS